MKKEIYITILLFAFMLFALISTVVRGQQLVSDRCSSSLPSQSIDNNKDADKVGINELRSRIEEAYLKQRINSSVSLTTLNRGLQVVNWSGRSLFVLLHSRGTRIKMLHCY